jgi:hypothetical protein
VAEPGLASRPRTVTRWRGQPLVFLLTVLCTWSAARVIHHWPVPDPATPGTTPVAAAGSPHPGPAARGADRTAARTLAARSLDRWRVLAPSVRMPGAQDGPPGRMAPAMPPSGSIGALEAAPLRKESGTAASLPPADAAAPQAGDAGLIAALDAVRPGHGRWSVYGWSLIRPGESGGSLAPGGQYGGSQAGLVVQWMLADRAVRPALYARATSALARGDDRTLALGISKRPVAGLPIDIAVERRLALVEGQADRWALLAAGGTAKVLAPTGTRLEVYGQAGFVGLARSQAFFDLQAMAVQPVHRRGDTVLAIGGGAWAGGQQNPDGRGGKPWLHRIDIGPRAALTLPVRDGTLTLALDWRQRIDGNARPGSDVALTLSAGF